VKPDLISKNPQKMLLLCTLRCEVLVYTVQPVLKICQTHFAKKSAKNSRRVCGGRLLMSVTMLNNLNNVFARYVADSGRIQYEHHL
jgi:hypothetical protein